MQHSSILGSLMLRSFQLFHWYGCLNHGYVFFEYIETLGILALGILGLRILGWGILGLCILGSGILG